MTASSVELFSSCRVQLVGLPQSAATNSNDIIRRNVVPSTTLPREATIVVAAPPSPRRVSRNLFGSPQPGEVRELLHQETQQHRSYFLERYNFDISPPDFADTTTKSTTTKRDPVYHHHHRQLPSLLAKELMDHEKRLLQEEADAEEECNLSRTPNSELPSTLISHSSSSLKKSGQVRRTVAAPAVVTTTSVTVGRETVDNLAPVITQNSASDRLKPYTRQTLITDCYSQRKMPHTNVNNYRTAVPVIATSQQQQQLNAMRLPKPVNSVVVSSSTSIPIPSSATNRDSVQADYTISLTTEATKEKQEEQQEQTPQLV